MKNFKRLVGLLLCLAMVLSFVPASVVSAAESTGTSTQNTTTSDILEKIDITGTAVGGCSTNSASQSDYTKLSWWNDTHDWDKHTKVVDGSTAISCDFGATLSAGERGDFYLDLTKKNGSAISADQLKLYYGAAEEADMPTVTITLDLETGSDVVKTFTTNWEGTTPGTPIEWDFGQTYDINGIYVYAESAAEVSFAELELYEYTELPSLTSATLNGRNLSDYVIVCDDVCLDYDRTAAEYIQKAILMKTGVRVPIVDDSTSASECEIIVGATNRAFSETLSAPANHAMKFAINANGTKIAMEADYFIIAGAAYYFVETYINNVEISNNSFASTCTTNGAQEVTPITKPAKNYIFLIGDGMGVMQTRLWEKHGPSPTAKDNATYGYSDGENIFYGEYLPYKGFSQTANIYGTITDSAAGGTALSTGYKTINGYVGRDQYENDIKNLSEIAWDMGKAVGIMSTEGSDGATPASFSAHTSGRYDDEVVSDQDILEAKGYVFVERYRGPEDAYNAVFKTYTAEEFGRWDAKVKVGMSKLVNDPDGFFVMYEEAYIDKLCHALEEENNPNATTTEDIFRAMYRFNQHIAYFMEFAMYNPDTFVLITADHETGGLNENWEPTQFNVAPETGNDHSLQDVPVYVYGQGGEVFHGVTAENASIGRTFAHIMTNGEADDFGDPQYPILLGSSSGEDVQLPTPEGLKATATTDTSITVTANGVYGGTLKFRINGGAWQSSGIFTGLTASTTYTIEAMYVGSTGYIDSQTTSISATTTEPAVKVELEPVPTNKLTNAMFGYYGQNISGDITSHLYSDEYPANRVIDGTDSETRSGAYYYSDMSGTLENQQKVPVIYIELTEATVLGGIKIEGWEHDRYNMENFVVQITTEQDNDNWKTVATVTQAFTEGDRGTACSPLTVEFNKTYTAYKVRILVDSISDMSSEAIGDDAGLAQYGYIRVKEITPLYDPSATPGQAPGDPTEPTTPPTQPTQPTEAPTSPVVNPDDPIKQGTVLQIVPATKITPQFGVYTDANLTAFVGGNDAYCLTDGWFGRHADSQKMTTDGTIAAILTLDNATTLGGIEIVGRAEAGNDMTSYRVQVKTANGWETVVTATSNPFDSGNRTVKYEFATPVATDEVRIIVDSCESTECKIGEIVLYEATTGKAYELIDLTGKGSSTDANPANPVDNLGDTDKTTVFLGSNATFNLTVDGQPTAVDGFNLFAYRGNNSHPTSVQVFVQQDEDGEYVEIGTFDTGWSDTYPLDSLTATFDQTYYAYSIRFVFDGWDYVNGLELYGYVPDEGGEEPEDPTDPTDPTEPTDPDVLPGVVLEPITNAPTPIVGYYTDNNTDGEVAEDNYWIQEGDKGKDPSVLVDGEKGKETGKNYNWTGYYTYDELATGAKIPVYLFEFYDDEGEPQPRAFTGVEIDGYEAMYYGMEDFTVQVYIEGKGWVTATTVADSFGAQTQEEYADPITYPFAEPLYGTKIRILVDKIWNMYDWRYDDENSFNLEYEASIRLREITLMEDPDYVPPEDAANTLMPPSSLNTEFTDTTITAVAPPSTEYPEAEIRYAVYLGGELVAANSTGIFTGLQPNTRYTIYAKYIGDGDEWLDSHPISNTTATDKLKLPTPNVEVDLTSTSITATADEVEGGELQFRLLNANHVAIGEWQSSGNFTGLTPNTTYYIQARYNGDTNHYDSEVRTLEVETGKTLLNKPTLTVSGTTHNTITLNALPTVTGGTAEYSYRVEGGEWIVASGNVITGLNPNTTYELRARYVATDDSYNTSLYSEVVTATTKKAPLPMPNVSVDNITDAGFTASADANENGTLMFRVNGGEWQTSGEFTGLDRNTTYTVEAMYVGKDGYSDSEVATIEATTLKTQLTNPTGFTVVATTENSITVKADTVTGGTLKFSIDGGEHWQTENIFTGLTHGTEYTIWAKYFADEDYIDSGVNTNTATTWTILDAPELTATSTDVTITATAPAVAGGTLMFRINGGKWQTSGAFTGLKSNTQYTIEAMYEAEAGYVSSTITKITVTTQKGIPGTNGDYAYLEAIRESDVTAHVGYYDYHLQYVLESRFETDATNINDAMYGTKTPIMGDVTVSREQLANGSRTLVVLYEMNNGTTKLGGVEITGGDYNMSKFEIQVKNTKGVWQTVKFVTNDLFDISQKLKNNTVFIEFTPVEGTELRLMIRDYDENPNNAPEIREMVIYEVKEDALQEKKTVTSADAPAVIDGNKATVYTGNTVTLSFNEATSVKRLKLFGNTETDSINGYTVKVQTEKGGEWTEVASGNAYSRAFNTSIVNLDKEYMAYGVQVIANGTAAIPEIEVYGYIDAPDYVDPTPPTTPGATAPTEATRPPVVSPIQTSPAATEKFEIPGTPDWVETTPVVSPEGAWSDPTPVVPDETGTEPTAPVATQPAEEEVVMGWLDEIEKSTITPYCGYLVNGEVTDNNASEAALANNGAYDGGAYLRGTASDESGKTPVAVFDWGSNKIVGGLELTVRAKVREDKHLTEFEVEVYNGSQWVQVLEVTSDPFTTCHTILFTFDTPVVGTKLRILPKDWTGSDPMILEATVYEVKTENAIKQVEINSVSVNYPGYRVSGALEHIIDGDKSDNENYYYYTYVRDGVMFTLDVADAGSPTEVSRVIIPAYGVSKFSPKKIKIELETPSGKVEVFNGNAYESGFKDTFILDLDKAYDATKIYLTVTSVIGDQLILNEIEVYGPGEGTIGGGSSGGSYTPSTPDYDLIDLDGCLIGACSDGTTADSNLWNLTWWATTSKNYNRISPMIDQNYSTTAYWGVSTGERADFLLDLSNGGNGTTIDQIRVSSSKYNNYKVPTSYTIVMLLKDGTTKTETFKTGWSQSTATGTVYTHNLSQTYTVTKMYVWADENDDTTEVTFGDFELLKKKTVQLETPTSLNATTVTENSITVVAPAITTGGTLKYRINGGAWQTSNTFEGLTAGTAYTIDAMYVAASGYTDSGMKTITVTTATPVILEYNVSGKIPAGANIQLYKDTKPTSYTATIDAEGNYTFSDVAIGNYTLVVTKAGHTTQMAQITVDKDVEKDFTLVSSYNVTGNATAGAEVTLYQNGVAKQTVTATDGKYTFNNVAIGNYTLVFTKHSYETQQVQITVDKDLTVQSVTLNYLTYSVSGTVNTGAEVTLYQNGIVKQTATATDGSYSFSNLEVGNYVLVATMSGYISDSLSIAVDKNLEGQNITLNPVPFNSTNVVVDAAVGPRYSVRLYEPWALRVKVTFCAVPGDMSTAIPLANFKSYGAYAVIAHKFGDGKTAPTSWEQIVNDPNAVQFRKAADEGDGNMFAVSDTIAAFDYYDGLYTYRLAENVYWVAYYEDMEGTIHFTEVRSPVLMNQVENIIGKIAGNADKDTERIVLEHMQELHYALKKFRGEDAEFGNIYKPGVLNYNQNLGENTTTGAKYQFGRSHRIRLIEPWGIMINMQVRIDGATYDFADAQDYGLIFFHDKDSVYNGTMTRDQMLARNDVHIYSKSRDESAWLESWNTAGTLGITAAYDQDIFTYEMDSELYYVAFVVDAEGNYHYSNAYGMNIIDQMYAYYNNTTLSTKERATFAAMIKLHESTMIHRKKFGK